MKNAAKNWVNQGTFMDILILFENDEQDVVTTGPGTRERRERTIISRVVNSRALELNGPNLPVVICSVGCVWCRR